MLYGLVSEALQVLEHASLVRSHLMFGFQTYMRRFAALPWGRNWALRLGWPAEGAAGLMVLRGGVADTSRAGGQD